MTEQEWMWYDDEGNEIMMCPCRRPFRWLEDSENNNENGNDDEAKDEVLLWEVLYTCGVLLFMFLALLSDRIGADSVMMMALTFFMAASIITIEEGLAGFANEGLLTVLTLFVVADGISRTGALDWYMGKLLGNPSTTASAQLRLMIPIAIVSAFLNNTPVVAVMIPIVQRWARNIHISAQQLLIPLSFASILGGTCTLIGTSTNLVVVGLLRERYPNDPSVSIGLFDLGQFGVPIAMAGLSYVLLVSSCLLPGSKQSTSNGNDGGAAILPLKNSEDILLGARLSPWSPAAGRSVKRSGLRDTGGIYLVSVHRAATGNVHRAVGQEFVLNVGDILYFTGLIEGFGEFCEEHGMEVLTEELEQTINKSKTTDTATSTQQQQQQQQQVQQEDEFVHRNESTLIPGKLLTVVEEDVPCEVGVTKESLIQADEAERSRSIARMIDIIRGVERDESQQHPQKQIQERNPHKVVVTSDDKGCVVVGVNANDRAGLLLDISKGLLRLNLTLRHSEASVVDQRSISIWRCELMDSELPDLEEIWSVLNALLENEDGTQAVKKRGLRVIRAVVTKNSSLIGRTPAQVQFRSVYKASIVAIQKGGRNVALSNVVFGHGDVLVLQASDDSPLLKSPPADYYAKNKESPKAKTASRSSSVASFVNLIARTVNMDNTQKKVSSQKKVEQQQSQEEKTEEVIVFDYPDVEAGEKTMSDEGVKSTGDSSGNDGFFIGGDLSEDEIDEEEDHPAANGQSGIVIADMVSSLASIVADETVWQDLQVVFQDKNQGGEDGAATREFLTAMEVAPKSSLSNRTVAEIGLDNLPGVFLVSIDRPTGKQEDKPRVTVFPSSASDVLSLGDLSDGKSLRTAEPIFTTISPDTQLLEGDVLWFAGSASSVGDLRKIPGLISYESEEVEKINEKVHDRRLVEAVVARRGPLVGKTVKEMRFRTRYGAAVIAVHRDGKRVHDHPGKIKLQAGDVLLLEAGPTFIKRSVDNDRSFALLAEVEDSAPPRLSLLIPALIITFAMLAVFTAGVASLLVCALVASFLMVALGILSEQEARDAVNWEIFITIAAAFGIGTALVNSGVAGGIATFLVNIGEAVGIGDAGLLGAVYFATFLISNVVTNNAAAALLFPIALDAAEQTGTDRIIMSYCLMLGASASFMSPFGYTTNLLIYGPGGYKYKDFLVVGTPMQVVLWILTILFLTLSGTNWWISWLLTFVALIVVAVLLSYDVSSIFSDTGDQKEVAEDHKIESGNPVTD